MKKLVAVVLTAVLLAFPLSSCSTSQAKQSASSSGVSSSSSAGKAVSTLIVGIQGDPVSFNPDIQPDDWGFEIAENVFDRLVKLDYNNKIIPDLADSWNITNGGKTYTFHLHQNVKWQDGKDFSSADVKFTFDTIIKNQGYLVGNLANVSSITTPDANTVVFNLKTADATLLSSLSFLGAFILPQHVYQGTDWTKNSANQEPIGTGPFAYSSYKKSDNITLTENPDYFRGASKVKKLIFRIIPDSNTALEAFNNGELDVLGVAPPTTAVNTLEKTDGVTVVKNNTLGRYYVAFNMTKSPWNKQQVREAFALAINRQDILSKAFNGIGKVAEGFYSPNLPWAYNANAVLPSQNIQQAQSLLEQAGFKKDSNGYYLTATLTSFNLTPFPDMATVIQSDLKQIGVNVKIDLLDENAWMQKCLTSKTYDFTAMGGSVGPDPSALAGRVGSKNALNIMGYSNTQVDALFTQGAALTDQDQRAAKYKQIQAILAKDLPIIPLVEDVTINVYKSSFTGLPYDQSLGKASMDEFTYVEQK